MKRYVVDIFKSCKEHDILNLSANISFFAILALLPLIMIFVSVLGHVIGSTHIVSQIANAITEVVPGAKDLFLSNVTNLLNKKSSFGIWGMICLLLISTVLFSSLERALDKIFESETKRNFFRSKFLSVGMIFLILLVLFLPTTVQVIETILMRFGLSVPLTEWLSGKTFFVIFAMISYIVTITIIPHQKIHIKYALVGSLIYSIGVTVAKYLVTWYFLLTFDRYNIIYGSLSVLILTIMWIYYLVTIYLFSAEVVAALQRRKG